MCLNRLFFLIGHFYLSVMWFGVALRIDINKACVLKRLDCVLSYDSHSRFNNQHNSGGGGGTCMTI